MLSLMAVSQDMASSPGQYALEELPSLGYCPFVLGQKLLPQGENSPYTATFALRHFLLRSTCPGVFSQAELNLFCPRTQVSFGGALVPGF